MAVVVDEDIGMVESVVRLIPLTLWRRDADVEKMLEDRDAGGQVVVVDVEMCEDVGGR